MNSSLSDRDEASDEQHTPGPWKVYHALLRPQFPGNKIIEVQEANGNAVVRWAGFDDSDRLKRTHLANARLIAAAPDLLEALRGVLRVADRKTDEFDAARAAIAKATREAKHTHD